MKWNISSEKKKKKKKAKKRATSVTKDLHSSELSASLNVFFQEVFPAFSPLLLSVEWQRNESSFSTLCHHNWSGPQEWSPTCVIDDNNKKKETETNEKYGGITGASSLLPFFRRSHADGKCRQTIPRIPRIAGKKARIFQSGDIPRTSSTNHHESLLPTRDLLPFYATLAELVLKVPENPRECEGIPRQFPH